MKRIVTYMLMLASICLASCEKSEDASLSADTVDFVIQPRANGDVSENTTYRILAYNATTYAYLGDKRTGTDYGYGTGTYYCPEGATSLVSCKVNVDGTFVEEAPNAGIRGTLGEVLLAYLSPAIPNHTDGTITFNPDSDSPLYCSPSQAFNVNGYGRVNLGSDTKLKDIRAKVVINFYATENKTFTINSNKVYIRGTGDDNVSVNFNPVTKRIKPTVEEKVGRSCGLTAVNVQEDDRTLLYTTSRLVPAAVYGNSLVLHYVMNQGDRDVDINVLLTSDSSNSKINELQPMLVYTFNIIALSDYVSVTADIYQPTSGEEGWSAEHWYEIEDDATIEPIEKDVPIRTFLIVKDEEANWVSRPIEDNPPIGSEPNGINKI